jgi:carbon storage regulator CsrA
MLFSSRKQKDENIVVTMLSIQGDKVQLGIEAQREMPVHRQEVHEEVRKMFLRLQNGTTLKAQEKRNAHSEKMRDFVESLAQHHRDRDRDLWRQGSPRD